MVIAEACQVLSRFDRADLWNLEKNCRRRSGAAESRNPLAKIETVENYRQRFASFRDEDFTRGDLVPLKEFVLNDTPLGSSVAHS